MDGYHHGVSPFEINEGVRPIPDISTNVIGMVCTAEDADADKFPLNEPVYLTSVADGLEKAGDKGTLARSLDTILDQSNAQAIIVRVPEGATPADTTTSIIGSAARGAQTGMHALRRAKAKYGVAPRILGIPQHDNAAVTGELVSLAQALNAFAYASAGDFEDPSEAVAYRDQFGARELMLIDGNFLRFDTTTKAYGRAMTVAAALGLRAKIDKERGFQKNLSNVEVLGVTGIERPRSWDLTEREHDLNYLNEHDVTGLIQHLGCRFWGGRNCSDDPLFQFEQYTRTAQILKDMIADSHFWAVDKDMNPSLMVDIAYGIDAKLKELTLKGRLLGGSVWVDRAINSKERVKNQIFRFDYDYTPVPNLENLEIAQRITDSYIVSFVDGVVQIVGGQPALG